MATGIVLAFASALLLAVTTTLGKRISVGGGLAFSLAVQYGFMVVFGASAVALFGTFSAPMDALGWVALAACGAVGYAGVAFMLLALRRTSVGVVMSVSKAYVFLAYLLNVLLFPGLESLSALRLVLGVAFFATLALFLFERDSNGGFRFGASMTFPLLTAVCWALYFVAMNWFVKTGRMTDLQTTLYAEGAIWLVALAVWATSAFRRRGTPPSASGHSGGRSPWAYFCWGASLYAGVLTANMAFARAPANLVNFVALSAVVIAPALAYVFFRERMTRAQVATAGLALALLAAFVLVG